MESEEINQEVPAINNAKDAGEAILNMWESEDQPQVEETETEEAEAPEVEDVIEEDYESEDEEYLEEPETFYSVKVDGEELEVNLEELQQGYQRQADYTRKAQKLAEQRKEVEGLSQEKQQIQQERAQYAEALQLLQNQQQDGLKEFQEVNWKQLKEDDPYEYMMKRDEFREAQDRIRITQEEQQRTYQQQMADYQSQYAQHLEVEQSKLINELPEWGDKDSNIKTRIRDYALGSGFSEQEVDTLADHRSILILKKAMEYDKLTKKVNPKKKAVKKVPKVQKAGRGRPKSDENVTAMKKKRTRLQKSGNVRDAASALEDFI